MAQLPIRSPHKASRKYLSRTAEASIKQSVIKVINFGAPPWKTTADFNQPTRTDKHIVYVYESEAQLELKWSNHLQVYTDGARSKDGSTRLSSHHKTSLFSTDLQPEFPRHHARNWQFSSLLNGLNNIALLQGKP